MNDSTTASRTSKLPRSERATAEHGLTNCQSSPEVPAHDRGRLTGCVQRVTSLTTVEREAMYALLSHYFTNVTGATFERDLAEKEWVIRLVDPASNQLQGFSTLMRLQTSVDNQPVVAFFSGDTIIQREYWGETELPRLWARHVFGLAALEQAPTYWFLISSGYKTYRFLPTFFREFYPTYAHPTPTPIKRVLDQLALQKFPAEYDAARGVVRLAQAAALQPGIADITERRLRDPHVAFFVAANPGHIQGDELACLTELTPANLTAAGRRMLGL